MKAGTERKLRVSAVGALIVSALFWASAYLFVKETLKTMSPYYLLAFRYLAAAALMLPFGWLRRKKMTREVFWGGLQMGVALFFEFLAFTVGLQYTTASRSSFIIAGYVVILPLAYLLIRRKLPKKQEIAAAGICMLGIGLILTGGTGGINRGDIITLFSAAAYAVHIVFTGIYAKKYDGFLLNTIQMLTAAALYTTVALCSGRSPAGFTAGQIGSILYLAAGATVLPYLLCLFGQKYVSTTTSGIILSFESVFATLLSIIFLHDRISIQFAVGGLLVVGAVFVSEYRTKKEDQNNGKRITKKK